MLRLAVDARDLAADARGIGRYTRAILRRLVSHPDIELTLLVAGPAAFLRRKRLAATLGSNRFHLATRPRRADVVWHPANGTFFPSNRPSVVTIHDAVPFRFPHSDPRKRADQQSPFLRSVHSAARIIAVSEFGREEVCDALRVLPDRIEVIPHGVDPVFSPGTPQDDLPADLRTRPYLLFVGHPYEEPRKNFLLLYDAYRAAFTHDAPPLVVLGAADPRREGVRYAGLAADDAAGKADTRLRSFYRGALALCLPSYYETFGMPAIEAMACGAPVIASSASCLPEIAGDAALYAPPHDVQAWCLALGRIAQDDALRAELSHAGIAHARRYDWNESTRRHVDVFRSLT